MKNPQEAICKHWKLPMSALLIVLLFAALRPTAWAGIRLAQIDAALQCRQGVQRFLAGDIAGAAPLLEEGFARRHLGSFALPAEEGQCALALAKIRHRNGDLDGALAASGIAFDIFKTSNDDNMIGITAAELGSLFFDMDRPRDAIPYLEQALAYVQVRDRLGEFKVLHDLGKANERISEYEKALSYYQEALNISRELAQHFDQPIVEVDIRTQMGRLLIKMGRYDHAFAEAQQALEILDRIGAKNKYEYMRTGSLLTLGQIERARRKYEQAMVYFERALELSQKFNQKELEANVRSLISRLYIEWGQLRKAMDSAQRAYIIAKDANNLLNEVQALGDIGECYFRQGHYDKALVKTREALEIARKLSLRDMETQLLRQIGVILIDQGRYSDALKHFLEGTQIAKDIHSRRREAEFMYYTALTYRKQSRYAEALALCEQLMEVSKVIDGRDLWGAAINERALIHTTRADYEAAISDFNEALKISRELKRPSDESAVLVNLALIDYWKGNFESALAGFEKALEIKETFDDRRAEIDTRVKLARTYLKLNSYESAHKELKKALAIWKEAGSPAVEVEVRLLHALGTLHHLRGEYLEANKYLEDAANLSISLRSGTGPSLTRRSVIGQFADIYFTLSRNYYLQGRYEQAFSASERGRARAFLDELTSGEIMLTDDALGQLLKKERELANQLRAIRGDLDRLRIEPDVNKALLERLEYRVNQIQQEYRATNIKIFNFGEDLAGSASGRPLGVDDIQKLLAPDTTLIAYYSLDQQGLEADPRQQFRKNTLGSMAVFLLTKDAYRIEELSVDYYALYEDLNSFYLFADLNNAHPKSLVDIHRQLIAPLLKKNYLATTNLIIVPHLLLHYVPFAALTDGKKHLLERFTISTLPSASTLPFVLKKRKPLTVASQALVMGNPLTKKDFLPPLDFAEGEARSIADLFDAQAMIGDKATKSAFLEAATTADIIHLAAHGRYISTNPLGSYIALADEPSQYPSGNLTVGEIYERLRFKKAGLVVLSACETKLGKISNGDEVLGLTRAFIFAGTPAVISTLWRVDEITTNRLMKNFYTNLIGGAGKAAALKEAQRSIKENYPHPYFWAAFVLSGDAGK